jgi:hypothetical protein
MLIWQALLILKKYGRARNLIVLKIIVLLHQEIFEKFETF